MTKMETPAVWGNETAGVGTEALTKPSFPTLKQPKTQVAPPPFRRWTVNATLLVEVQA